MTIAPSQQQHSNQTAQVMRAATLVAPGQIEIECTPIPEPAPDQVRVKLEGCGVCASNIPLWEGRPWFNYPMEPGAPGHEGWGCIDAVGAKVEGLKPGDRVALLSSHAYAEYDLAHANAVVKLSPAFDGIPFPGEPLGCAMNIFRRSAIRENDVVAIVGVGFLGALLTKLVSRAGARVIAISRRAHSFEVANRMGAWKTLPFSCASEVCEQVRSATGGKLCDVVIEATGKQAPLDLAAELTRERGRLIIAGYHQDGLRQINLQLWNWRGLDVINAHEREESVYVEGMRLAAKAIEQRDINPAPLYTHTFPLEQLGEALQMAALCPSGFIKALIAMQP